MLFLIFVGGLLWMGQFIWFPDGDKLLSLVCKDHHPPASQEEKWATELYRETFAPKTGVRWLATSLVLSGWVSWVCVFLAASLVSLVAANLLPKNAMIAWCLIMDSAAYLVSMVAMLFLLALETWLLRRKHIPLRPGVRKKDWLASHPSSVTAFLKGKLPWWFWLDSGLPETLLRFVVFFGGFLASLAAILYMSHVNNPDIMTVANFWEVFVSWVLAILCLPLPITIWMSYIDWTHRDREVLLLWAARQG
ncbi:MAG: hypothetical protein AB7E44_02520 [Acidithiobacillus sp.]